MQAAAQLIGWPLSRLSLPPAWRSNQPHHIKSASVSSGLSWQTSKTLPGVMVEAYLRNVQQKKSFFIRYGAGSRRSLTASIRLSAEMLVSQLETRRRSRELAGAP